MTEHTIQYSSTVLAWMEIISRESPHFRRARHGIAGSGVSLRDCDGVDWPCVSAEVHRAALQHAKNKVVTEKKLVLRARPIVAPVGNLCYFCLRNYPGNLY